MQAQYTYPVSAHAATSVRAEMSVGTAWELSELGDTVGQSDCLWWNKYLGSDP